MTLVNEKVEHINFGFGVITEEQDHKIWVQFQEEIGKKAFLYPESFEKFLKAVNPAVASKVMEEGQRKQEQIELKRIERERVYIELRENTAKSTQSKRKTTSKATKK